MWTGGDGISVRRDTAACATMAGTAEADDGLATRVERILARSSGAVG